MFTGVLSLSPPPFHPRPVFPMYNLTRSPLTAALYYLNAWNRLCIVRRRQGAKFFRSIDSVSSAVSLQADVDCLHFWSTYHFMRFNTAKCKVLHMTRKRFWRGPQHSLQLSGHNLASVSEVSDLSVDVTGQLSWATHIEELCAKGNRVLGLVKRVCGQDVSNVPTRKLLYMSLARSTLKCSSCRWSPYSVKHHSSLENIQRRGTKFLIHYPPREVHVAYFTDWNNLIFFP